MTTEALRAGQEFRPRAERTDRWWVEPLITGLVFGAFALYATWAGFLGSSGYYAAPYLSPFYSPCLAVNCEHVTIPLVGAWWIFSPAILILWIPLGFRTTCYYYRKAYYRAYFWSPPACAIPDAGKKYSGESQFPFILQNIHRYFFWFSILIVLFLWWDVLIAFNFGGRFGIGLGTIVLGVNALLLSLYTISCHAGRHLCGGGLKRFSEAPMRYKLWRFITGLNENHMRFAWVSLVFVALADFYVRLVAAGVIVDPRLVF